MNTPTTHQRVLARLRAAEVKTRPTDPEMRAVLAERWAALPERVRTPAQVLGRGAVGCEGTHGVFPRCNLACTPCYHSRDANQVRTDGTHTIRQVTAQFDLLRAKRGPRAHAQLIGGEVSLLAPDDHFEALRIMREHGREPMSMSHGDFDYDYLTALTIGQDGRRRIDRVSFAGHFDMLMFGRRGIERPTDEASLNPYRQRFAQMFHKLRQEHGVRFYIAHNMTVTPSNIDQIPQVIRANRHLGFAMFSFQPAAFIGDNRRWHEDYSVTAEDDVWARIEDGVGRRIPWRAAQMGDERCNRTSYGFYVGDDWIPLLDDEDPADMRARNMYLNTMRGMNFADRSVPVLVVKLVRAALAHPALGFEAIRFVARKVRRAGFRRLLKHPRVHIVAFTMHSFMDATDVRPAWDALKRGETLSEPRLAATQERLRSCFYAMAHPETGDLVPACAQHGVLDPQENRQLRVDLPMPVVRGARRDTPIAQRVPSHV